MDTAKEKIPKQFRIGDTCFTSLATIEGGLFTRHPKISILYTKTVIIFYQ